MTAPIASGWSGCRVGLAPTGKRRLVTAHAMNGNLCRRRIVADVTTYTKKKGRLRHHKRPKSREETPKEGSDSGGYRITLSKTIAIRGSIERRETAGIQREQGTKPRFMALALKPAISATGQSRHFRRASVTSGRPRHADILEVRRHVSKVPKPEISPKAKPLDARSVRFPNRAEDTLCRSAAP